MHLFEPPHRRAIREAEEAQQRYLAGKQPVTWSEVFWFSLMSACLFIAPFPMQGNPKITAWSPWPEAGSILSAICLACAAAAAWRGVRKGWTQEQTTNAGFTLGCWVFGIPITLALVAWIWSMVSGALVGTPWWAVVIIVLLVALLLKK